MCPVLNILSLYGVNKN